MQGIRAFVGHSFSEADRDVVSKFLEHFRTLTRVYPGFTWDHAEEADLKTLSEKVLAKIEDKNVFIGICTRRERAVEDTALSRSRFQKSKLIGAESDFKWKTSDWIIQEIGLAIGRKMKLILFLEEGTREPGGLYGNLEYISFTRSHPHDCFDKLLQMLSRLSPAETTAPPSEAKPATSDESSTLEPSESDWEPNPSWTEEKYESAVVRMIFDNNEDGLNKVDQAFKSSKFAQGDALPLWEARIQHFRLLLGKNPDLEKLQSLADENPTNSQILSYLAYGYSKYGEYDKAAKLYEEAAKVSTDSAEALRYKSRAIVQCAKDNSTALAKKMLEKMKADESENPALGEVVLSTIRELADIEKNDDLQIAVMERKVELHPSDTGARFSVAYKHSECENNDMALHHYRIIPPASRDAATWNNLGVSYGEFGVPVKAVRAFRKAEASSETLAMSNIGFKFLSAGFIDEAQNICTKALAVTDYHKNIASLLNRLQETPEEEENKINEVIAKVKAKAAFYRKLGEASVLPVPKSIAAKWQSPNCVLDVVVDRTTVRMTGSYESKNPFAGALSGVLGLGGDASSSGVAHNTISYTGELWGRMIIGRVARSRNGQKPTLLEAAGGSKTLMYFSLDMKEIHVMEMPQSTDPNIYVLKSVS